MISFQELFFEIQLISKENDRYSWRKLIERYYLEDSGQNIDDLFFLVHNNLTIGMEEVLVKRRSNTTLSSFESYLNDICINYEHTFYLNLISQMKFYLRFSSCSLINDHEHELKVPLKINKQIIQEIYSTIIRLDNHSKKSVIIFIQIFVFLVRI